MKVAISKSEVNGSNSNSLITADQKSYGHWNLIFSSLISLSNSSLDESNQLNTNFISILNGSKLTQCFLNWLFWFHSPLPGIKYVPWGIQKQCQLLAHTIQGCILCCTCKLALWFYIIASNKWLKNMDWCWKGISRNMLNCKLQVTSYIKCTKHQLFEEVCVFILLFQFMIPNPASFDNQKIFARVPSIFLTSNLPELEILTGREQDRHFVMSVVLWC